jgi:Spx/MgsR family transcriptional regulator
MGKCFCERCRQIQRKQFALAVYNRVLTAGENMRLRLANILYGIKNCDTMKCARQWLDTHGIVYRFHDYQRSGVERERLTHWCDELGWELLLNRAGTTFRKLAEADKVQLDRHKAIALMLAAPSMVKRPVLEYGGGLLVGFKPETYNQLAAELRAGQ